MAASLDGEQRLLLEDRVELPRLYISWLTPAMFAADDAELDLAADLLANGKTSRLYRRLVFDERIATDVSASQNSREIGGFLQLAATAAPGHTLAELERVMLDEIARLAAEGPTRQEIDRGRVQAESQFMFRLQTVGGFGGKSDQLNAYNVFVGDPAYFDRDLARYNGATAASVRRAAATYLPPCPPRHAERRAARPPRARGSRLHSGEGVVTVNRAQLPEPRRGRPFVFPAIEKSQLPNGLRVWTVRHAAVPVVTSLLLVRRGSASDPAGKEGLAAITLDMLDEGSGGRSAIEMHEALARLGAQFDSDIGADAAALSVTTLSRFAGQGLAIVADMAARPSLADADFARVRQLRLHRLTQLRDLPGAVADRAFVRLLYGDHPYGHTPMGSEPSLAGHDGRRCARVSRGCDQPVDRHADYRRRLRARRDSPAGGRRVRRMARRRGGARRLR